PDPPDRGAALCTSRPDALQDSCWVDLPGLPGIRDRRRIPALSSGRNIHGGIYRDRESTRITLAPLGGIGIPHGGREAISISAPPSACGARTPHTRAFPPPAHP